MKSLSRIGAVVLIVLGVGLLAAWALSGPAPARLDWTATPPVVRETMMSFAYKVYANPDVADGRYYLSKVVLKNTGGRPVRDLAVSYQVPDHIPWTTPEVTASLPGGATLVKLFYPKFTERITRLANKTTATLEIKLQWREERDGPLEEEILRDNFTLLGLSELQYSDLPGAEIGTWYDNWTMAQFMVCMVTPNDPVVKEYAAAITERTGGSMAGVTRSPEDVMELMRATYDYMIDTGMRYAGAKGVPERIGDETKLVQTVRLPRDVITSNNGLCIELAILWASIMDHLGCHSYLVLRPGHAFTVVMAEGRMFPIECTAITPKAVGSEGRVPFEKAVEMAAKDLEQQQLKIFYNVQEYQQSGYASPELPDIDLEKIKGILASRQRAPAPVTIVQGGGAPVPQGPGMPTPPAGMMRFAHQQGLVAFNYPAQWMPQAPMAVFGNTFSVIDPATNSSMQVYEIPGAATVEQAIGMMTQTFAPAGMFLQVNAARPQGNATILDGTTRSAGAAYQWMGAFRVVRGGVIGVTLGSPDYAYGSTRPMLLQLLNNIQFGQ